MTIDPSPVLEIAATVFKTLIPVLVFAIITKKYLF